MILNQLIKEKIVEITTNVKNKSQKRPKISQKKP